MHTNTAARLSAFANPMGGPDEAPRGGGLMLRYPDGALRNLTREAGFGNTGVQGANEIAVCEPSVHRSGTRAIFSMLVGAPTRPGQVMAAWQLHEIRELGRGQRAVITRVSGQPAGYNNVSPLYASNGAVLSPSDCPRDGSAHL